MKPTASRRSLRGASPSSVKYDFSVYGTCKPGSYAKSHRLYLKRNSTGQQWTSFYKVLSGAQGASGGAAEVRNIGSAASQATQLKTFVTVGGRTQTFTTAVPPLSPGATTKIKVLFPGLLTGQVRGYTIKLRVDDPNVVKESNESNNSHVH